MNADRFRRARRSQALDMQQSALLQLLLASITMLVLALAGGYALVVSREVHSPRAVAPVLDAFMRAGQAGDSLRGHVLLSDRGLRRYSQGDVAALFAKRTYFEGFQRVRIVSMHLQPVAGPGTPRSAQITASVTYASSPPATLTAITELQEDQWHIESIELSRPAPEAP